MNNDLISRAHAIEVVREMVHDPDIGDDVATFGCMVWGALDRMPAVDAGPKWISVQDKLPDTEDWVVVWYRDKDGDCFPTIGSYGERAFGRKYWTTDVDLNDAAYPPAAITHWMPLPEPPKN